MPRATVVLLRRQQPIRLVLGATVAYMLGVPAPTAFVLICIRRSVGIQEVGSVFDIPLRMPQGGYTSVPRMTGKRFKMSNLPPLLFFPACTRRGWSRKGLIVGSWHLLATLLVVLHEVADCRSHVFELFAVLETLLFTPLLVLLQPLDGWNDWAHVGGKFIMAAIRFSKTGFKNADIFRGLFHVTTKL